ncbi:MAG TPA: SigE family RNA polymerase sigma factor [Mycobacteriales bacterium]|nr:SigE family RNA polymerase sigma factor [Mycobacteriales bacterium]
MDEPSAAAFDELVRAASPRLLRTCYLLTGDAGLAEDLLQTALAKTYLKWDKVRDRGAGEAYVRAVAVNTATKWWRRKWRGEVSTEVLPDRAGTDPYAAADERAVLRRALLSLPPAQRAVVVLRFFDDLGEQEVADVLGVGVGTVKSRTSRALAKLRTDPVVTALLDDEVLTEPEGSPA